MIKDYPIVGLISGSSQRPTVKGNVITYKSASADLPVKVRALGEQENTVINVELLPGERVFSDEGFERIIFETESTSAVDCVFAIGTDPLESDRVNGKLEIAPASGDINALDQFEVAATPAVQTIPENLSRKTLEILTDVSNAGVIWVGGAAGKGIPLIGGAAMQINSTSQVDFLGTNAGDKFYALEVE
ncbi:MAG: hypothetical protein V6Z82_07015 [Flavobacteriales bacterium]